MGTVVEGAGGSSIQNLVYRTISDGTAANKLGAATINFAPTDSVQGTTVLYLNPAPLKNWMRAFSGPFADPNHCFCASITSPTDAPVQERVFHICLQDVIRFEYFRSQSFLPTLLSAFECSSAGSMLSTLNTSQIAPMAGF